MTEKIIPEGRDLIASFEQGPGGGPALTPYLCPAGVLTIGYGHTKGVKPGDRLASKAAAEALLDEDLLAYAADVDELVGSAPTSRHERAAMTSLNYNIGRGGFAKSTVLRLHKAGDKAGAARAFAMWNKASVGGQLVEMPGLTRRRAAETALYLTPDSDGHIERIPAMPQEVAPPAKASSSKAVLTNVGVAAGATALAVENVKPAIDAVNSAVEAAKSAQGTWESLRDLLSPLANGHVYTALIAVAITLAAVYLIRRIVRRVKAGEITP